MKRYILVLAAICLIQTLLAQERVRDHGIQIGILPAGPYNAITDVPGVRVGHTTLIQGTDVRTGVTAILPHTGNVFQEKVPAAIYVGNGFGKLAGYTQVRELGTLETPIILTNTLSVPVAVRALINYTLELPENQNVRSVNAVVGETNDGYLNDIRGSHVTENDILQAIASAGNGKVDEGNVGAGTGTVCFGFKGGIGTSSRILPDALGGYSVGILVQTNFGGVLEIAGVPVAREWDRYPFRDAIGKSDGSCMVIVATDAPLSPRNLERLARRAVFGIAKTGGIASNGSGDYVIAFSTNEAVRVPYDQPDGSIQEKPELRNDAMTPLFLAVIEATEEAILNSLFAAETLEGRDGHVVEALPVDDVLSLMRTYRAKLNPER